MNKFNTDLKSKIIEAQQKYLFDRLFMKLKDQMSNQEISALVTETIRRYYLSLGRPLTIVRTADTGHLPFIEDYNTTMDEIVADTSILYNEIEAVGNAIVDNFNYAQSERLRITNRIKNLGSLTNDLSLLANENAGSSVYVRDSFTDMSQIEANMIMGTPAQISTREGIVTLARTGTINRSAQASIKMIQGDGEKGTMHLARKASVASSSNPTEFTQSVSFLFEATPNNDPEVMLDNRPDTIFEYQMVNVNRDDIINIAKEYDFEWVKGKQTGDKLRVKIVVELKDPVDVNWINIDPYHPANSTGKVTVYSIRTSEDGFDYKALYENQSYVINAEINTTPQTYRQDEIFDGKNDYAASKFSGQGVWSFATRKAKYVEFVLDQDESYAETIGHFYYERVTTSKDTTGIEKETAMRIPSTAVPENILSGQPGKYLITEKEYIRKSIDVFSGWRYAIGIRDINIMSYQFAEKSELISTKYTSTKPIKEVMLYANEKIPEAFLGDLTKANDWIQYFISIDDVNWHQITPVHQHATTKTEIPPKIYEINSTNIDLEKSFQLYKGYLKSEEPAKSIRLKVIMQRPTNIQSAEAFTPILEDYSLRLVHEDEKA